MLCQMLWFGTKICLKVIGLWYGYNNITFSLSMFDGKAFGLGMSFHRFMHFMRSLSHWKIKRIALIPFIFKSTNQISEAKEFSICLLPTNTRDMTNQCVIWAGTESYMYAFICARHQLWANSPRSFHFIFNRTFVITFHLYEFHTMKRLGAQQRRHNLMRCHLTCRIM